MSRLIVLALAATASCTGGSAATSGTDTQAATTTSPATTSSGSTATTDATSSSSGGTSTTMASTTGSASDGTSSADDTAGCSFLCKPDGCAMGECDPFLQDCCPGEKCNAWAKDGASAWNATKCVPVDPNPDAVGEPCSAEGSGISGVDSCEKGAMCWNVDPETSVGVCVKLCEGNYVQCDRDPYSCCPDGFICSIPASGVLVLCVDACHPLLQDCAYRGEACYPYGDRFQCTLDVSGDIGAPGDACEYINVCDPGTFCGVPEAYPGCNKLAGGCCIPFCDLEAPACTPGTECEPWYEPMEAPSGYENLGACVIP